MGEKITGDAGGSTARVAAPSLNYRPPRPREALPIGLIGCGGIAPYHLAAYRTCGYNVTALCDVELGKAEALAEEFYPRAEVTDAAFSLIQDPDIPVIDIALHPESRGPIVEAALRAGKHVLSQKPFVRDLDEGERLIEVARECGRQLAVNQNGRWAPHFSYMRAAVDAGLLGELSAIQCVVHWDHGWTAGTAFDEIPHLVLYDFGVHWFDIVATLMGARRVAQSVYAMVEHSAGQKPKPPMIAHALIAYEGATASLAFHGGVEFGATDFTRIIGTKGVLESRGLDLNHQTVTLHTADGIATPELEGDWFTSGFQGTMGELLCAIEEGREAANGAASSLAGLGLCFAAARSADEGIAIVPGTVRRI